jgi:PHD/YefM family antitoxin component YafN of YafNO toxin-antitoxin module
MPSFHKLLTQKPVVVLRNNRPSFVAIHPDEYEKLIAACEELHYANLFEEIVAARQHNQKIPWRKAKKLLAH